jgi:hypothetical protein
MGSEVERRVESLLHDEALDRAAKVSKLRQMEADAMARQRASTEGMSPAASRDAEDLKAVEKALLELGETAIDTGPASL